MTAYLQILSTFIFLSNYRLQFHVHVCIPGYHVRMLSCIIYFYTREGTLYRGCRVCACVRVYIVHTHHTYIKIYIIYNILYTVLTCGTHMLYTCVLLSYIHDVIDVYLIFEPNYNRQEGSCLQGTSHVLHHEQIY